jgi:ankyrin repeat protein
MWFTNRLAIRILFGALAGLMLAGSIGFLIQRLQATRLKDPTTELARLLWYHPSYPLDYERIEYLISSGASPRDLRDEYGDTLLHCAITDKEFPFVERVLDAEHDFNAQSTFYRGTVLDYAIKDGAPAELIEGLIKRGARVTNNAAPPWEPPVVAAVIRGDPAVVEVLLHYGGSPDCISRDGRPAIDVAATMGQPAIAGALGRARSRHGAEK